LLILITNVTMYYVSKGYNSGLLRVSFSTNIGELCWQQLSFMILYEQVFLFFS